MQTESQRTLNLLLPKGSLQSETLELFQRAGYALNGYTETDRSYRATFCGDNEFQIKISRPQEIPVYVGMDDFYDLGITGQDWVEETDSDVEEILPLEYGHIDIILAVREERADIRTFEDLMNRADGDILISTEYLNIAEKYILEKTENRVAPTILTPWKRLNTPALISPLSRSCCLLEQLRENRLKKPMLSSTIRQHHGVQSRRMHSKRLNFYANPKLPLLPIRRHSEIRGSQKRLKHLSRHSRKVCGDGGVRHFRGTFDLRRHRLTVYATKMAQTNSLCYQKKDTD